MTVSFALRGHPHASAATRDRIRQIAKDLDYRPNPLIAASMAQLRLGRRSTYAGTLAFAGMGPPPQKDSDDSVEHRVFHAARLRADSLGYRLEWFALDDPNVDGRRLTEILSARGIIGVIVAANCLVPSRSHLDWSRFALAALGRTDVGQELHRISGDYYLAIREICQRCRTRGYRRIGLVVSTDHDAAHQGLHRSALLGCQAEWPRRDHVPTLIAEQGQKGPFLDWIRRHQPDVVLASDDSPGHWLKAAGYRIPEDIGFIRPHVNRRALGVCGFEFNDHELGSAAIDVVVEQMNHNERGMPTTVKRVLLRGQWFEGRSIRAEVASTNDAKSTEPTSARVRHPRRR